MKILELLNLKGKVKKDSAVAGGGRSSRWGESGNVFFALFGAVALVGVVGATTSTLMRGPVGTVVKLNNAAKADSQMQISHKLAMLEAAQQANSGDCDGDGYVEPIGPLTTADGNCSGPVPTGGGCLPNEIGSAKTDPWGTNYGYCAWDHGPSVSSGCSAYGANNASALDGTTTSGEVVIAVVSAGPDRVFQTSCAADPAYLSQTSPTDDLVVEVTYAGAVEATGGLWALKSGDPDTATISKDIEVEGQARFQSGGEFAGGSFGMMDNSRLEFLGSNSLLFLPDEIASATCNGVNQGALRRNTSGGTQEVVEVCDFSNAGDWVEVGGSGSVISASGASGAIQLSDGAGGFSSDTDGTPFTYSSASNTLSVPIISTSGNVTVGGTLQVDGVAADINADTDIDGTLIVSGAISDGDSAVTVDDDLVVTGTSDLQGNVSDSGGDLTLDDAVVITGTSDLQGNVSDSGGDLTLDDAVVITGTADIQGDISDSGGNVTVNDALDVTGDATVTGDVIANALRLDGDGGSFDEGIYYDGANGLEIRTQGSAVFSADSAGDVLIPGQLVVGTGNSGIDLDVAGELRLRSAGYSQGTACSNAGSLSYSSGDTLLVCSSITSQWETIGTSGGGGAGAVTPWEDNTGYISYENHSYIVGNGYDLNYAGALEGAGTRWLWYASAGAMRAGAVTGTEWDDENVGQYSAAFGYDAEASGESSFAAGDSTVASAEDSIALGAAVEARATQAVALGNQAIVAAGATNSMAIGLGTAAGSAPQVVSSDSFAVFMGDQSGVSFNTPNAMLIAGGGLIIDADTTSATNIDIDGGGSIVVDVEGGVGATRFCNEDGADCFTAADVSGGSLGAPGNDREILFNSGDTMSTDTTFVYTSAGYFGIGTTAPEAALHIDADGKIILGDSSVGSSGGKLDINIADTETERQGIKVFVEQNDGTNYGINATAFGTATKNVALYGNASNATDNWGLWVDAGISVFDEGLAIIGSALSDGSGSGGQALEVDITGDVGADNYCDADGLNCFTAAAIANGGGGLWTDNTTHITYTSSGAHFINSGESLPADMDDDGTRMFFYPDKAAFRGGLLDIFNDGAWEDTNIGSNSFAYGYNARASGISSIAMGNTVSADGVSSIALGDNAVASNILSIALGAGVGATGYASFATGFYTSSGGLTSTALGREALAAGDYSFAFGLGDSSGGDPDGSMPQVSGTSSYGIFMGDQTGVDISTSNLMALMGGKLVIDPDTTSASNTTPSGSLTVDVTGDIGAVNYCDEDGNNCFTASSIAGGGGGLWTDNTTHISYTSGNAHVVNSGESLPASLQNNGTRMFYYADKSAFRGGKLDFFNDAWYDANIGDNSFAYGNNVRAVGNESVAMGSLASAYGTGSIALGRSFSYSTYSTAVGQGYATNQYTFAGGRYASAGGLVSVALGQDATASGDYSFAFGLGDASGAASARPLVSGASSYGIFMGDQTGVDISTSNLMALMGGKLVIDPDTTSASNTTPSGSLTVDVTGDIGADNYCDADGLNCFTAAAIAGGGGGLWTDNTTHITYTSSSAHFINSGESLPADMDDNGTRMFFYPDKYAFRGGGITLNNDAWQDANIGNYSFAYGLNNQVSGNNSVSFGDGNTITGRSSAAIGESLTSGATASFAAGSGSSVTGTRSAVFGYYNTVSGGYALAQGRNLTVSGDYGIGFGYDMRVAGNNSVGLGLGGFDGDGSVPEVSGEESVGIFMNDQTSVDITATRTLALLGGTMIIDPTAPASETAASTGGDQNLELDVEGDIGAVNYCDEDGNNCFTASSIAGGGGGLWTDNTTHISYTSSGAHFINSGESLPADMDDAGSRIFYYADKAALRGGTIIGANDAWQDGNIGSNSFAWGENAQASGSGSVAMGYNTTASNDDSVSLGSGATASGQYSVALGDASDASGESSVAMGWAAQAIGERSVAIGTEAWALGSRSTALGAYTNASGIFSTAMGFYATAGSGTAGDGTGDGSAAFGLIDDAVTITVKPKVTGIQSAAFFMGDQDGVTAAADNTFSILGGTMIIDPAVPATETAASTGGDQNLELDVEGDIGAVNYCDEDGNNCFTASSIAGGGGGLWTDNTTHITYTSSGAHFINSGEALPADMDDNGTRMFYYADKAALRGGTISGANDAWQDGNIGSNSFAWGENAQANGTIAIALGNATTAGSAYTLATGNNTTASGLASTALGSNTTASAMNSTAMGVGTAASGISSTAIGSQAVAGSGTSGDGAGDGSAAFGLIDDAVTITVKPKVTGIQSAAFFMGDQDGVTAAADNTFSILGGTMIIDPAVPATETAASTGGDQNLELDVEGDIGAVNYCDEDGNNCFTASSIAGGGGGLWTDNTTHITYTSSGAHFINSGESLPADMDDNGTRMFFYPDKYAFRGGRINGNDAWQDGNIGDYSFAYGLNVEASNTYSIAMGNNSTASGSGSMALGNGATSSGQGSFSLGFGTTAINQGSVAIGYNTNALGYYGTAMGYNANANGNGSFAAGYYSSASGHSSVSLGREALASGNNSFAFGLGDSSGGNPDGSMPRVSGTSSYGIFMGDQTGVNISTSNLMALMGGKLVIDPDTTSASNTAPSGSLTVDVTGDIGAVNYCDEDGNNCFTAASVSGGGGGLWDVGAGDDIYYDSGTAQVGIGTSSPQSTLDMEGTLTIVQSGGVAGTDQIEISHDGVTANIINQGNGTGVNEFIKFTGDHYSSGTIDYSFDNAGQMRTSNSSLRFVLNGTQAAAISGNGFSVGSDKKFLWSFDTNPAGTPDTGIERSSANVLKVTDGSTGWGSIMAGNMAVGSLVLSSAGEQALELDVTGDIGAVNYCDEDGNNCFTAASVSGGGSLDDLTDAVNDATNNNIFIAHEGGSAGDNNDNNTAVGIGALDALDNSAVQSYHGDNNTAFGYNALTANTTGYSNTAIGRSTLAANVSGLANVAVGANALSANTSSYNTALGYDALTSNDSGNYNTAIGHSAMNSNDTARFNTAVGSQALAANVSGENNSVLGYLAMASSTAAQNTVSVGNFSLNSYGGSGGYNVALGGDALRFVSSGNDNVAVGWQAGRAGASANITGNVFVGVRSGNAMTSGNYNVFLGMESGVANTSGSTNVAIGRLALNSNTAGSAGVAIGTSSQQYVNDTSSAWVNYNTSIGYQALQGSTTASNNTGNYNTVLGYEALSKNTSGGSNVAIGSHAGKFITGGATLNETTSTSIFIGRDTKANADGDSNEIVIGYNATGAGSNTVTLGNSSVTKTVLQGDVWTQQICDETGANCKDISGGWASGSATPAGADTQVQFNDGGATMGADTGMTFNKTTDVLSLAGGVSVATGGQLTMVNHGATEIYFTGTSSGANISSAHDLYLLAGAGEQLNFGSNGTNSQMILDDGDLSMSGDLTISGDDLIMGTNTSGMLLVADGTNFNPTAASGDVTINGSGVTAIGADKITEAMLKAVDAAADEECLTYETTTGDFEWQSCGGSVSFTSLTDTPANYTGAAKKMLAVNSGGTAVEFTNIYHLSGNLGVGVASPDAPIDVSGDIEYTGTLTDLSDRRLKKDIRLLEQKDVMDRLMNVDTYSFRMKDDPEGKLELGVMAQELELLFPELVKTAKDEMGTKSVNYMGLIAPLIETSKGLKAENDALKAELAQVKATQADILAQVNGLKAHTGYGVNKAGFGIMMLLAMFSGMGLICFAGYFAKRRDA